MVVLLECSVMICLHIKFCTQDESSDERDVGPIVTIPLIIIGEFRSQYITTGDIVIFDSCFGNSWSDSFSFCH